MKIPLVGLVIALNVYPLGVFGQEAAVAQSPAAATTQGSAVSAAILRSGASANSRFGAVSWQSPARVRHWLSKTRGVLKIDEQGVEFRPSKGPILNWSFLDVHTFFISPRQLVIETYQNRRHHVPGVQRYGFDLAQGVPPEVAAGLAREVQRPSQNAVPDLASPGAENIPSRHRTRAGGTNGTLRIHDSGIDYVTSVAGDSRSWRWADLETLSEPDPYHLFVFGYRDTYTFDLKEPLTRALFNRLTDEIYSHSSPEKGRGPDVQVPNGSESHAPGSWR
jgi:hypothetical protein